MRTALALLACAALAGTTFLACRSRLPVDHVPRPVPGASEAPAAPSTPTPPVAAAAPLLHVEYYQISDG